MITFSKYAPASRARGFTLTELMVTLSIFGIVMGSIIPTFIFFSQSIKSLGNYTIMSGESRNTLELIGRDLHAAEGLRKATETELEIVLPSETGIAAVNYAFDAADQSLVRTELNGSGSVLSQRTLFTDLNRFKFVYYNRRGVNVSNASSALLEANSIQINAELVRKVARFSTSDYIISARFLMRNFD